MKSNLDFYVGHFVTANGQVRLDIIKKIENDKWLPNYNLLAGIVWGHSLRNATGK